MWWTSSLEAEVDERKAEGARCSALRMPRPPALTRREAWVHALSLRWVGIGDGGHS